MARLNRKNTEIKPEKRRIKKNKILQYLNFILLLGLYVFIWAMMKK